MNVLHNAPLLGLSTLAALVLTAALPRPAAAQLTIIANITDPQNAPQPGLNASIQTDFNAFASDFPLTTPLTLTAAITWDNEGPSGLGTSTSDSGSFQTEHNVSVYNPNNPGSPQIVPDVLVFNPLAQYTYGAPPTVTAGAPDGSDFSIQLNDVDTLYSSTLATPTDPNAYSLADVLFHETIHSMGFTADNDANGAYSFGTPTLWDTLMYDGNTKQLFIDDTQAQRAAVMTSGTDANGDGGELFFIGKNAEAANGGQPVQLFAPNVFQPGSSDGSHIGPQNALSLDLLDPTAFPGTFTTPSKVDLGALADLGWTTQDNFGGAPVPEASTMASFSLLLALGLGGIAVARKRKTANKPT